MKFFTNKENSKKIIIILLIIMLFNLVSPKISQAGLDEFGGKLFSPIAQLLCAIGDLVIEGLQDIFTGDGDIGASQSSYSIHYSPGLIFANKVGLGVNFFNPDEDSIVKIMDSKTEELCKTYPRDNIEEVLTFIKEESNAVDKVLSDLGYKQSASNKDQETIDKNFKVSDEDCKTSWIKEFKLSEINYRLLYDSQQNKVTVYNISEDDIVFEESAYYGGEYGTKEETFKNLIALAKTELESTIEKPKDSEEYNKKKEEFLAAVKKCLENVRSERARVGNYRIVKESFQFEGITFLIEEDRAAPNYDIYLKKVVIENEKEIKTVKYKSISKELQAIVATWYKALRAIALVGLLSVLVYVGIRMLLSSSSQDKAKYKSMMFDWLVAIFILFVLQYIMAFTLDIANKITEVLSVNIVGEQGQDLLMSNVRNALVDDDDFTQTFAELLIYLVLVIFTVVFTIQYLKRLLYMAFFTLIAPLIALTYPLDKIKDGQAQAFTMWIREYIFNSLLQPMHLLIYFIFVSSADYLVEENWIYAIVAIGFMVPAEKFFRKMFGFDKAESAGQSGTMAAAGGALVMNAINKMGSSSGKHASGGKGGAEGSEGSGGGSTPRYVPSPNEKTSGDTSESPQIGPQPYNGQQLGGYALGQTIDPAGAAGARSFRNGARTLKGHYFNKTNGKKLLKGAGRIARKGIIGAAGAATLGTVGLAAGIATGDAGNAFKYGLAGAGVGYAGANNLGDKAVAFEKKNREIFKEGTLGTDEYNTRNSIKELTNDNDFNNVCKHLGVTGKAEKEQLIRQFHSNGITSASDIKKAMNAGASTNNRNRDQIIAAAKIRKQATQYGMKRKDIEEMIKNNQPNISDTDLKNAMDLIDML